MKKTAIFAITAVIAGSVSAQVLYRPVTSNSYDRAEIREMERRNQYNRHNTRNETRAEREREYQREKLVEQRHYQARENQRHNLHRNERNRESLRREGMLNR